MPRSTRAAAASPHPRPQPQQPSKTAAGDTQVIQARKVLKEAGVNTSRRLMADRSAPRVLCSSPSGSHRSTSLDGEDRLEELAEKLKDVSAIAPPNEDENESQASSVCSQRIERTNPATTVPKKVTSTSRREDSVSMNGAAAAADADVSSHSIDSLPRFPSFDRSGFWKDVFSAAGLSMTETIAGVLREAKITNQRIEKSLSLLSLSEEECSQSERHASRDAAAAIAAAAVARSSRHETLMTSAASSPLKRRPS